MRQTHFNKDNFLKRLEKVNGCLSFRMYSFLSEKDKELYKGKDAMNGIWWSVGYGLGSEKVDGDWGKEIFGYLFGDEKESERCFNNLREKEIEELKEYEEMQTQLKNEPKKQKSGFIYVIKCKNLYKIGKAKNIKQRVINYKTENPFKTTTIIQVKVPNYNDTEKYLLNKFRDKKIKGEWFKLNENDLQEIKDFLIKQIYE